MMREILFRGKRKDNGGWIEGDLRQYPNGRVAIRSDELLHTMIVAPETVGQYTGLKDKNGQRIFEGDVVRCTDAGQKSRWKVTFDIIYSAGIYTPGFPMRDYRNALHEYGPDVEVIGNVHDNPELMKVQYE